MKVVDQVSGEVSNSRFKCAKVEAFSHLTFYRSIVRLKWQVWDTGYVRMILELLTALNNRKFIR